MSPQQAVRIVKNFIKQNKANLASRAGKRASVPSKVEVKNESKEDPIIIKSENIKKNTTKEAPVKTTAKNSLMPEPIDETKARKFAALSPKVFRKTTFLTEVLQREIKIPKLDMRRPSMRFDPAYNRKLPLYLDIPELYRKDQQHQRIPCHVIGV